MSSENTLAKFDNAICTLRLWKYAMLNAVSFHISILSSLDPNC